MQQQEQIQFPVEHKISMLKMQLSVHPRILNFPRQPLTFWLLKFDLKGYQGWGKFFEGKIWAGEEQLP